MIAGLPPPLEKECEGPTTRYVWPRPLTFTEYLRLEETKARVELIDGVLVERPMAPYTHEDLFGWLYSVLRFYARRRGLGKVLGSRTAVGVNDFRSRLPDILFVRQDRLGVIQELALTEAPDLVIEIVSPGDRLSDRNALETDYRNIGVGEIVLIDRPRQEVRAVRRRGDGYAEEVLTEGGLTLESLGGVRLEVEWLLRNPLPDEQAVLDSLLSQTP